MFMDSLLVAVQVVKQLFSREMPRQSALEVTLAEVCVFPLDGVEFTLSNRQKDVLQPEDI
jgi:hypothetical protein